MKSLICLGYAWNTNTNVDLSMDPCLVGLPIHSKDDPTERQPSSPTSSGSWDSDENSTGEIWEELDAYFQVQEAGFVDETPIDEGTTTLITSGAPFNTVGIFEIQELNMPTRSASPCQPQLHVPSFSSTLSHSPTPTSSRPPPHPPLFGQYIEPPMQADGFPHMYSSPTGCFTHTTSNDRLASTNVARTSPTGRFFAFSDQIEALIDWGAWVHGTVINTLGDFFC